MDCRKLCTPDQNQQETLNPTDSLPIPDTGMAAVYTGVYNPRPYFTELPHLIFFLILCVWFACMYVLALETGSHYGALVVLELAT